MPTFIGIDYHKAYSVYSVVDAQGSSLGHGRIDHARAEDFRALVRRWPGCRVVFEAGMNRHWLFEILESELAPRKFGAQVRAQPTRYGTNPGHRGRHRDRRYRALPLGSEALWLRRFVSFHPQQRGQDFSRQTATTLQQMAPLAPSSRPPGLPSVARPTSGTSTNASERLARSPASPSWPRGVSWPESPGSS